MTNRLTSTLAAACAFGALLPLSATFAQSAPQNAGLPSLGEVLALPSPADQGVVLPEYLLERQKLFLARIGLQNEAFRRVLPSGYYDLLKDDAAFASFLTDDASATRTLDRIFNGETPSSYLARRGFKMVRPADPDPVVDLGPIYSGVSPGTGS